MSKEPTAAFPGFAEIQEFWQSAWKKGGAMTNGSPDAFAGFQAASTTWMSHRQADFAKAIETWSRMSSCQSPAEAFALQQRWLRESWQSLVVDWMALMNPAAFGAQRPRPAPSVVAMPGKKAQDKAAG